MISIPQIELNVCQAYIARVRESLPPGNPVGEKYLLLLSIREWQLKRRLLKRVATLDDLQTLKTGHREAEAFLLEISIGSNKKVIAEIEAVLQSIGIEFFAEIQAIEDAHPHLRAEFAREREVYRIMWNHHVAAEAELQEARSQQDTN